MTSSTIADVVVGSVRDTGEFSLLLRALETANLTGAVADPNADLTVFAPTDAAFVKLARSLGVTVADRDEDAAFDGIVGALSTLGDPVQLLSEVLLYHVTPGGQTVAALQSAGQVATAATGGPALGFENGELVDLDPTLTNPRFVEGLTDIAAANGTIQVIDAVLLPLDVAEARDPSADETLTGDADANVLAGDDGRDQLFGRNGDDLLEGGNGDDDLDGGFGNDTVDGGAGDDLLLGGEGHDDLTGGAGDDFLVGGEGGDRFRFDPSREGEGHDTIRDFNLGEDAIVLNAVDIADADPDIAGADGIVQPADFDSSSDWNLVDAHGDLAVEHPNGTIRLDNVSFDAALTFEALVHAGALVVEGLVQGDDEANTLVGDQDATMADLINGLGGDDVLRGGDDDDILIGGHGADRFQFDPSNQGEGADRIADFMIGEDRIVLDPADVLASDPTLDIGGASLEEIFAALDASEAWTLAPSADSDVVIGHPGGTIELEGVQVDAVADLVGEVSFAAVAPAVVALDTLVSEDPSVS